ncbi:unnamed protein product [Ambrosiozyma monospora]|uniref:Mitochondrial pyruvate carrier n=1 Tax=Ambrosiozyma monospora TaxID=43982 RepID=A0A9W6WI18_AMBMO|nr:unnamed protein product [Ambrosiozyma monospora]
MSSAFKRFLGSETGPKTVHFWWALVFASIGENARPVETVSGTQQLALFATGSIWTRWSFVITPKNMLLASVNFFLAAVAGGQLVRILNWRRSEGDSFFTAVKYIVDGKTVPATAIDDKAPVASPAPSA